MSSVISEIYILKLAIGNITESLEFESENIKYLISEIHELKSNLKTRDTEIEDSKRAISLMQSEINALERYTRGFNIRIMGMTENEDEDCVASVQNLLHDSFDITEPVIENAHRVGSTRAGKPRQMIARFHSRATRRYIMTKARERLQNTQYRIVDDLTAKDLDEKRRLLPLMNKLYQEKQERQGRWCIFDTGWSHWINYLVKEDTMKVAWPGSNEIILVSGMKIVAKSQSDLWRLIMNSSAKFKADSISGVYAKIYHRIGTSNTNSAKDVH